MDIPQFSKSDPLIVLLNEVEILLAQTRLMELHVKRAESLSGDRIARLQEEYQSELAVLRSAVAKSDEALAAQKNVFAGTPELHERSKSLEEQLRAERQMLEARDAELLRANSAIAELQDRISQMESAREWTQAKFEAAAREREGLEIDLTTLRASLEEAQSRSQSAALATAEQQRDLQTQLAETNARAERLRAALERATALEQHAAELVTANEALAAQVRQFADERRSQAEDIEALRHQVAAQERALMGRQEAVTAVELALHAKIQTIQQDLARSRREIAERDRAVEKAQAANDALRRDHEAEVAALRASLNALDENEHHAERQSWENALTREQQKTAELSRRLVQLENRDREAELRLKNHEQETASALADAAALRARGFQLEALMQEQERTFKNSAAAEQKRLEAELAAVQEELRDKAWTLARQQAAFENLALVHKNQLQKLESKIDEQQHAFESQGRELAQARAHAQSPGQRDARETGFQKGEETMKEHVAMKTDDVDQQPTKSSANPAEPAASTSADQALHDEIARLRQEAQEKNQILQNRNDELVRVKAQLDQLHERLAQLESSSQEESPATVEAERVRTEFQAQLALLQAELSQKQWAQEDRQAKARTVEQSLRQELDSLRRQLAANEAAEQAGPEFVFGGPGANHDGDEVFGLNGANDAAPGAFASQRRWNRGLGWKRRWRS